MCSYSCQKSVGIQPGKEKKQSSKIRLAKQGWRTPLDGFILKTSTCLHRFYSNKCYQYPCLKYGLGILYGGMGWCVLMCAGLTEAHVSRSLPNKLFVDISQKESLLVQYFVAPTQLALFTNRLQMEPENQILPDLRIKESRAPAPSLDALSLVLSGVWQQPWDYPSPHVPALSLTLDQKLKMPFIIMILYITTKSEPQTQLKLVPRP